jgi:hypothetical protein
MYEKYMEPIPEVIPEPPVMKVEDDSTPIEKVVVKPPPPPPPPRPPVQAYKPPPPQVQKPPPPPPPPPKELYEPKQDNTLMSAAFVGVLAVILSSPAFKGLMEKMLPKFANGPVSYAIIFVLAAVLFVAFQKQSV